MQALGRLSVKAAMTIHCSNQHHWRLGSYHFLYPIRLFLNFGSDGLTLKFYLSLFLKCGSDGLTLKFYLSLFLKCGSDGLTLKFYLSLFLNCGSDGLTWQLRNHLAVAHGASHGWEAGTCGHLPIVSANPTLPPTLLLLPSFLGFFFFDFSDFFFGRGSAPSSPF